MNKKVKLRRLSLSVPFFACLSIEELESISDVIVDKKFTKNHVILSEDDTLRYMYIIYCGKVKVVKMAANGQEYLLTVHDKGDFFGEMGLLDGKTSPATVIAMEDCKIGLISKVDFYRYLFSNTKVLHGIIKVLCARLRESWLKLKVINFKDAESRIRVVLQNLSMEHGIREGRGTAINLKLTHREISEYTFLSRETVSRHLRNLVTSNEIEILPQKRLLLKPTFFKKAPIW